jgi:Ca2+-transporting ATPase
VGIATPIFAVQILLIDMIGEMFPLIMLTYDPPEKRMMKMPPRNPKDKILTKETMMGILFNGTVMGLAAYVAFLAEYFHNHHLAHHYEKAMTVTFVSVVFGQYANLLSRRTYGPALGKYLFSNRSLLIAFALSISLMLLLIYVPVFNLYFHTSSLMPVDWLFPLTAGALCLIIYEYRKKQMNKRMNQGTLFPL